MEKLLFLCRRAAGLDPDEYREQLLRRHVPLALAHHAGLQRYVINTVQRGSPHHPEIDSVNELVVDDAERFLAEPATSPEGAKLLSEDAQRFVAGAYGYATREVVHREGDLSRRPGVRTPGQKWFGAVRRHLDLGVESFRERWLFEHVPLMLEHQPSIARLTTDVVVRNLFGTGDDWDLFYEVHFAPGLRDHGLFGSPEGEQLLLASHAALVHRRATFVVEELPQRLDDNGI